MVITLLLSPDQHSSAFRLSVFGFRSGGGRFDGAGGADSDLPRWETPCSVTN